MLFFCVVSLALIAFGIFLLAKPQFYFELTESWKHGGSSEPSDLFILSTRFGGIMCIVVGVSCPVVLLLNYFNVI